MIGYSAQGTGARTSPAIPGLQGGTPSVSNRQLPQPAQPAAPGAPNAPVVAGGGDYAGTPQQIRDQIRTEIRNAIRNGNTPVISLPSDFVRNAVPQGAVDISIAFFFMVGFIIVGLPFARAIARRMDGRSQQMASGAATLAPQIEQLQQSVDAMAIELERITEAQRFQSKLMAAREKEPARFER